MRRTPARETVYDRFDKEREYQRLRWGIPKNNVDGQPLEEAPHSIDEFTLYMQDYLTEAIHHASRDADMKNCLHALRKVVCLGLACFEQHECPDRDLTNVVNARGWMAV